MGSNGLEASMWAPRPGEWSCASCRFINYAWRKECFRCKLSRTEKMPQRENVPQQEENVGYQNEPNFRPLSPQTVSGNQPRSLQNAESELADRFDPQKYGLATSRWAPRNHRPGGPSGQPHKPQIWTRTVRVTEPQLQSSSTTLSRNAKPPDLGLPYEVQHYILTMIQRILEEGCYDFASRWIPGKLVEYGWSCAELVELSTWRKTLPELLPSNAIKAVPGTTLEQGLENATRIRNSAVHRHLCDNTEIKRMALQAQNLMAMFADVTREHKLHHLQMELSDWNTLSGVDPQAARNKLQAALQEISERPVNDMDWTPNSVSLEEVGLERFVDAPVADIASVDENFGLGDEMELD